MSAGSARSSTLTFLKVSTASSYPPKVLALGSNDRLRSLLHAFEDEAVRVPLLLDMQRWQV